MHFYGNFLRFNHFCSRSIGTFMQLWALELRSLVVSTQDWSSVQQGFKSTQTPHLPPKLLVDWALHWKKCVENASEQDDMGMNIVIVNVVVSLWNIDFGHTFKYKKPKSRCLKVALCIMVHLSSRFFNSVSYYPIAPRPLKIATAKGLSICKRSPATIPLLYSKARSRSTFATMYGNFSVYYSII